jgi:hypothetical protein
VGGGVSNLMQSGMNAGAGGPVIPWLGAWLVAFGIGSITDGDSASPSPSPQLVPSTRMERRRKGVRRARRTRKCYADGDASGVVTDVDSDYERGGRPNEVKRC